MKALVMIAGLMALPSAAQAAGADDLVATFKNVCMGEAPAFETVETLAKAKGWSQDEKLSGERSRMATQSIIAKVWNTPSEGLPDMVVNVTKITTKTSASNGFHETCSVLQRRFRHESTEAKLKAALNLPEPHRRVPGIHEMSQWDLNPSQSDHLVLGEQTVQQTDLTQIARARSLSKEKP